MKEIQGSNFVPSECLSFSPAANQFLFSLFNRPGPIRITSGRDSVNDADSGDIGVGEAHKNGKEIPSQFQPS